MLANLGMFIRSAANLAPDADALRQAHRTISYRQLDQDTDRIARNLISAGLKKGDRVVLSMPNSIEFVLAYFAIAKAGCIAVPFNVMLKEAEMAHILSDSGALAAIYSDDEANNRSREIVDAARNSDCRFFWSADCIPLDGSACDSPTCLASLLNGAATDGSVSLPMTDADDVAVILYTSGTTGTPKGAMLTHGNLSMSGLINAETMGYGRNETIILTLPLFHVFGQVVLMLGGISRMACLELVPRFDPLAVLDIMATRDVTMFGGVPTMYSALVSAAAKLPEDQMERIRGSLRLCISGASSLAPDLAEHFERRFAASVLDGYGLTEASPTVAFSSRQGPRKAGSVGKAAWGVEVRIVSDKGYDADVGELGEIWCRGPGIFAGYWNNEAATRDAVEDGWLKTGDIGSKDAEGYVRIVDRIKEIIIRGGYNVYPTEVEHVLLQHPAVDMCAVVGVADDHYGEEVAAHIVKKQGDETKAEAIVDWARARLAGYKYPRVIVFRDALPLTGSGKVMKRML